MATVNVNGMSLEYIEHGEGEPLVLVHGSASDYRTWQDQLDVFGKHFRTIAYSRRYHWPNEPISEGADYSMAGHVDDLQAVLSSFDAKPAHLVGHSYGAFLCLLLAIRSPELVRTLVLTEPPVITLYVSDPPKPAEILKLLVTRPMVAAAIIKFGATGIAPATKAARQGDMEKAMRIFGTAILGRDFYNRLSGKRLEQVQANAIQAEFLGSGFASLDADEVRNIQAPTLLITGRHSASLFGRLSDRLEELLPNVERAGFEDASHIVHEDVPLAYNEAVLSFLSKHQLQTA